MPTNPLSAARRVCQRGDWQISNLALQKLLYLAQMVHLGRSRGQRLIDAQFEAWDYGPVIPEVYHKVKMFGDRPIQDIFFSAPRDVDESAAGALDEITDRFGRKTPAELVAMTHWRSGAWARNYRSGVSGIVIPDRDIIAEYAARTREPQRS